MEGGVSCRYHQAHGTPEGSDREPSRFAARPSANTTLNRVGRPSAYLAAANRDGSRSGGTGKIGPWSGHLLSDRRRLARTRRPFRQPRQPPAQGSQKSMASGGWVRGFHRRCGSRGSSGSAVDSRRKASSFDRGPALAFAAQIAVTTLALAGHYSIWHGCACERHA